MELIIDNGYSQAYYDNESRLIYAKYTGDFNMEMGLESLKAQKEYALKHGIYGTIADFSTLRGTFSPLSVWVEKEFFPPLIEKGLVCAAIILPKNILSSLATTTLLKRSWDFPFQAFDNIKNAEEWAFGIISKTCSLKQ